MVRLLKLADLLAHIIPVYNVNRKDWSIFPPPPLFVHTIIHQHFRTIDSSISYREGAVVNLNI